MPYILAYLLILLDISILPSILEPFVVWSLGYLIIISNLYKKDPLDPRIWLFLGVGILLINGFSGILYVPSNINEQKNHHICYAYYFFLSLRIRKVREC